MTHFETRGGVVTQGETLSKLLWHLDEATDCLHTLAHLEREQVNNLGKSRAIADGWFAMGEMFRHIRQGIIRLGQGKLS